jgi:purine nucleosidase/pyrimidine-specific ribonucleoside hydrolase
MPDRTPVIIDTDPGVDDALALLLAAASPELEVLAVTTVGGNIGLDRATENARRIVSVAWEGRAPPPVHRGGVGGDETAEAVHGTDGLGGATALLSEDGAPLYPALVGLAPGDGPETLLSLARERPGEVTLITLGPLTNVAEALRRDYAALRGLKQVVIMGGAFREPGNTGPVAEFNVFVDPEAAQAVCDAGLPLKWAPLDVTHRCLLREEHLERLPDTRPARFARHVTDFYIRYHVGGYGEAACFLHDPLAVGAVIWPELLRAVPLRVNVETDGRFTRGMTVADFRPPAYRSPSRPNSEVCLEVDADRFVSRFLERLGAV